MMSSAQGCRASARLSECRIEATKAREVSQLSVITVKSSAGGARRIVRLAHETSFRTAMTGVR